MNAQISVVVTDLDNTLYDWFEAWYASFSAMLDELVHQSGVAREVLEREFRAIHQKYGTSEYAFSIEELPSLKQKHPEALHLAEMYQTAIDAFRAARRATLKLYPGVLETLESFKKRGCLLVGYTESMAFYTNYRMRKLGLDSILDFLYSPPDHELPEKLTAEEIRHYPKDQYELKKTVHRVTPKDELKPNPALLLDIIRDVGAPKEKTIYVGDSKMKDVYMAQRGGIIDVWAEYGAVQHKPGYDLLRRVSHWTETDVEKEKEIMRDAKQIVPTYVLKHGFKELLDFFDFVPFKK